MRRLPQTAEKILSYLDLGRQKAPGADRAANRRKWAATWTAATRAAHRVQGHNKCASSRKKSLARAGGDHLQDEAEALEFANDTLYGLGAGVEPQWQQRPTAWGAPSRRSRVDQLLPRLPCTHAAFGGYKGIGIGRETHKMMLMDHYQQTKNPLVSLQRKQAGLLLIC